MALLITFADQAVIAIENVRLFNELQARTEALTRSVGQLTALGEVGQAISSTLDLETVLKTIVSRAVQLTGLDGGSIYEYDERAEEFRLQAAENMPQDVAEDIRKAPTRKGDGALGRTAITLEPTQVPDTLDEQLPKRCARSYSSAPDIVRSSRCRCCARTTCSAGCWSTGRRRGRSRRRSSNC